MPDAIGDRGATALQFDHADRDAIDVKYQIRATLGGSFKGYLLGDRKIVVVRLVPVDQLNQLSNFSGLNLDRDAITQERIDSLVVGIKAPAVIVGLGAQLVQRAADLRRCVTATGEKVVEEVFLDVAIARTVRPIAKIAITKLIAKELKNSVLGGAFGFANHHVCNSWTRISAFT
ncbi:hypothetical protein MJC1_02710 [Methylocystis sp. MJC1]|nr:hypothetical protein MJC1_02710 [Methylocystis sp. MJC1]